jgi:hypothetical protein
MHVLFSFYSFSGEMYHFQQSNMNQNDETFLPFPLGIKIDPTKTKVWSTTKKSVESWSACHTQFFMK